MFRFHILLVLALLSTCQLGRIVPWVKFAPADVGLGVFASLVARFSRGPMAEDEALVETALTLLCLRSLRRRL